MHAHTYTEIKLLLLGGFVLSRHFKLGPYSFSHKKITMITHVRDGICGMQRAIRTNKYHPFISLYPFNNLIDRLILTLFNDAILTAELERRS
jgi:hypothetical protein